MTLHSFGPITFFGLIFFISQILKKLAKIATKKSPTQVQNDSSEIDKEITALKAEQQNYDAISSFVDYSLINRKINALLKKKEKNELHFKLPTAKRRHVQCAGVGRDRTHAARPQGSRVCPP